MAKAGLKLEYVSEDVMPRGREFFEDEAEENYAQDVKPEAMIVHNNFIKGHERKRDRFQKYHLWWVDDVDFPECQE